MVYYLLIRHTPLLANAVGVQKYRIDEIVTPRLGEPQSLTIKKIFDPEGEIGGSSHYEIDAEMKKLKETIALLELYEEKD